MRAAIVGAGIAGLACAEVLTRHGLDVVLLDKGRGPGGRMSTRRVPTALGEASFDHGAQYFTARDDRFAAQVRVWVADGVAAPWPAAGEDAFVGTPAMNAPVRRLAAGRDIRWATRVVDLGRHDGRWRVTAEGGAVGDLDLVVLAIPAEQAADLLRTAATDLAAIAAASVSEPCWTVMAAFGEPVDIAEDCLRPESADGSDVLGWAARNSAKPGRTGPESWVLQGGPEWSRRHLDDDPRQVVEALLSALGLISTGGRLPAPLAAVAHRWLFARCAPGGPGPILDADRRLGLCGDWLTGPRVESAWLSGVRLAELVVS